MKKKMARYFLICLVTYLSLAAAEIFLLRPVVDMVTMNFWGRFAIYCMLLLIVDPFATKMIADHFDLNKDVIEEEDV